MEDVHNNESVVTLEEVAKVLRKALGKDCWSQEGRAACALYDAWLLHNDGVEERAAEVRKHGVRELARRARADLERDS